MDGPRALRDMADLAASSFDMPLRNGDSLDDDRIVLRKRAHDDAGLSFVLARYHFYFVSFFDVHDRFCYEKSELENLTPVTLFQQENTGISFMEESLCVMWVVIFIVECGRVKKI